MRGQLAKTKLTSYQRGVVEFIGWKVAWEEGTYGYFATTMTKFGWKDARLDKGIEDCSRRLIQIARFKSKFEWEN